MTASIEVHMNTMRIRLQGLGPKLNAAVDWFIPADLMQAKKDTLQAVRMFLFSHLFGPLLGHTISVSMLIIGGEADLSWWIFFLGVTAFWPMAFLLRLTGWYVPLALVSIENLMFCIFWGCYQYGGMSSPIMPWLVTVPLLAFFYLPERSTRIAVAILIVANLALFYGIYSSTGFRTTVAPQGLVLLGLISTFCASVYVSMMALYHASIVSSQGELEQEVLRHETTERQLRDAADQAHRALLAKSEFLAKMSHELKNPLNAVIGYSEILIEEAGVDDTQKCRDLTSIRGAGYRLLSLIDSLLELSRLEAGRVQLRAEAIEFAGFIEGLAARSRPDIEAGGNQFVVAPPPVGRVVCDANKLQRVVEGLLSNAAKFTQNGQVTLSATLFEDSCQLSVRDTGIGIGRERMAGLFETFGLSEDETASKYGSEVRLGLPLAYRYCRLMGGELVVDSAPGQGSTVTVTLPRRLRVDEGRPNARVDLQLRPA